MHVPAQADAVVVLGGHDEVTRVRLGQRLAGRLQAALVVSVNSDRDCRNLFGDPVPSGITCFRPDPFTTQGEAEYAARLAGIRGWHTLLVVTTPDQVQRARLRFTRCFSGSIAAAATSSSLLSRIERVPYEWAATGKALFIQRSC